VLRNPAFDDTQGVGLLTPEEVALLDAEAAQSTVDEGCPQDFTPAGELGTPLSGRKEAGQTPPPAKAASTAKRPQRRSAPKPAPKPTATTPQDDFAVQEAYFASLKRIDDTQTKPAFDPSRFLTWEQASQLPTSDYTVKGVLPAQGVALLSGQPAVGKSFTMLSSLAHVSEGWPLCGRRVKKRPVVYLSLEGSGGLGKRIQAFRAWTKATGKPEMKGTFLFWTHSFKLDDQGYCDALIKALLDAGLQGAVVCIDTLSQSLGSTDENSSDIAAAIGKATQIAEAIGGLVLLIHHLGKDTSRGPRGHSSLVGNVDCAISVTKDGSGRDVLWTVTKSKDDADGQTVGFKLHVIELGLDADGDEVTSCAAEPCRPERPEKPKASAVAGVLKPGSAAEKCFNTFLKALHEAKTEGVHVDAWRPLYYKESTADPKSKKGLFHTYRGKLVDMGVLSVDDDVYTLTPEFRQKLQADTAAGVKGKG